jgi:hypothetical protein
MPKPLLYDHTGAAIEPEEKQASGAWNWAAIAVILALLGVTYAVKNALDNRTDQSVYVMRLYDYAPNADDKAMALPKLGLI